MFLFGGNTDNSTQITKATGISVQTSCQGKPITLLWGQTRTSGNLIYMNDFDAKEVDSDYSKGFGGGSSTSYEYYVTWAMGICEGPATCVSIIKDSEVTSNDDIGLTFFTGSADQTPWAYLTGAHPDDALYYPRLAYAAIANQDLGTSNAISQYSFIMKGRGSDGPLSPDANMADVIQDALSDEIIGLGFPASRIKSSLTQYSNYCLALGLAVSPCLESATEFTSTLGDWVKSTNSEVVYDGLYLDVVPYGDSAATGNGVTYTPPSVPVASLYDYAGDFLQGDNDEGPVKLSRSRSADAYNATKIECLERDNDYNTAVVEYQYELFINLYGYYPDDTKSYHWFVDPDVAAMVAQLLCHRNQLLNTYEFKVGIKWGTRLMPMDVIAITESRTKLSGHLVRIESLEEGDNREWTVKARDYVEGMGSTGSVTTQGSSGYNPRQPGGSGTTLNPGSVNAPIIFEPHTALSNGKAQIWLVVSGASGDWGGCVVYISTDGEGYTRAGSISKGNGAGGRQGVLTAAFAAGSDPDTANTLSVDLTESLSSLIAVSQSQADNHESLSFVDGELIAYSAATLKASYKYDLAIYIRRGLYGTAIGAHASGSRFARLSSGSYYVYEYNSAYAGKTIYLKFLSFDYNGGNLQTLDEATAYTFVPTGDSYYSAEDNDYWTLRSDGDWEPKS